MDRRRADFGQTFPKPVAHEEQERIANRSDAAHCAPFGSGPANARYAEAILGRNDAGADIIEFAEVSEPQAVRATMQEETQGTREIDSC